MPAYLRGYSILSDELIPILVAGTRSPEAPRAFRISSKVEEKLLRRADVKSISMNKKGEECIPSSQYQRKIFHHQASEMHFEWNT
ncbi:unnamed protein product [Larinioides sclopetarius]|uniref:Uncharacterized protein n=1 Tax=Larinioides sclopetarius TaxID=280406 RepID=A0AAV2AZZ9_9ARAC